MQYIFQAKVLDWVPFLFPGDLPDPGIEPGSPALRADALPSEPPGKPTMEYYSAIKRNKIGSFAETWVDLENIIQSEVVRTTNTVY